MQSRGGPHQPWHSKTADLRECPRDVTTDASIAAPGFSASPSSPNRLRVREWNPAPRRRAGESDACREAQVMVEVTRPCEGRCLHPALH